MLFDQANKVRGSVAGECGFGEVRIGGKKIFRRGVQVGEIAAAAAGDQDFLADSIGALQDQRTPPALAGFDGTHQSGSASPKNDDVVFLLDFRLHAALLNHTASVWQAALAAVWPEEQLLAWDCYLPGPSIPCWA